MVKIDQYKFGKFVGKMSILTLIIHGEILGVPLAPSRGAIGHVQIYDHGPWGNLQDVSVMVYVFGYH